MPEVAGVEGVGLALAGPVHRQTCRITNLPWMFDAAVLSERLGAPVRLLNDFEAVGHALPALPSSGRVEVQAGAAEQDAPIALLGAGTGPGEAIVLPGPGGLRVVAGEGGHADLAAQSAVQDALMVTLRARHGHVSWERILSGAGLATLYELLAAASLARVDPATTAAMARTDPAAVVTARADSDPLCGEALDAFLAWYGADAGVDLATIGFLTWARLSDTWKFL